PLATCHYFFEGVGFGGGAFAGAFGAEVGFDGAFAGAFCGAGVVGAGTGFAGVVAGAVCDAGAERVRKGEPPGVLVAHTASVTAVIIKIAPSTHVAFCSVEIGRASCRERV